MSLNAYIFSINNTPIDMHVNTHNSHFINHLLRIVGGNGAGRGICVRAQTIKLIVIYKLHVKGIYRWFY